MSRVLALIGAVCLIAAAILARAVLTDDGDGDGAGGDDGDAELVVACVPELQEACEAIDRPMELTIEDPADTIARVADGEDIDAWVTFDPWPAMAEVIERRDVFPNRVAVSSDDLVLLARRGQVPDECSAVTWTCLVDDLGDSVSVPDPDTALGALILGFAATDFFGGPFAANDLQEPDFAARLAALDSSTRDPLEDIRVGLPEPVATGALALQLPSLGNRLDQFTQQSGAVPGTVAVVVAGPDADRIAGEPSFTRALADLGWSVDAAAATSGLPNAGVLIALQGAVG